MSGAQKVSALLHEAVVDTQLTHGDVVSGGNMTLN